MSSEMREHEDGEILWRCPVELAGNVAHAFVPMHVKFAGIGWVAIYKCACWHSFGGDIHAFWQVNLADLLAPRCPGCVAALAGEVAEGA